MLGNELVYVACPRYRLDVLSSRTTMRDMFEKKCEDSGMKRVI
jgi:hypothetical protein